MVRVVVLLGTVREGRQSEHVARHVHKALAARPGVTAQLLDPRELGFGDLVQREFEMPAHSPKVAAFMEAVTAADAFVIVTPEYNHSYPGALKNMLDLTFKPWNRKPFGLVGCGGLSGGLRAIEALRQVVAGLGAVSVPAHVSVPYVGKAFTADGPVDPEFDRRLGRFLDEVEWYAKALKAAR
ncbi:MAG: hypothetical protein QOD77_454 [Thermoplasmata archaeon]|jgi:NAD(P)H-dependent FMN reductase|nr:hypothetical protein [Thermoplasmata archaeon]